MTPALRHYGLHQEFLDRATAAPYPAIPAGIRGILDTEQKAIYVIEERRHRRRWVGAHEIGHYAIEEHREILKYCSYADLEPSARSQIEREANEYGGTYLFQGTRFAEECLDHSFSLEMLRSQARRWQVSNEAAFRRFAEQHPSAVALAVCKPAGPGAAPYTSREARAQLRDQPIKLSYWVASKTYRGRGLDLQAGQLFGPDHLITDSVSSGKSDHYGEVSIGSVRLPMALFFTGYAALILIGLPLRGTANS